MVGLEGLRAARALTTLPMFAIGGITAESVGEIMAAGADGVAVISAILKAPDLGAAIRTFQQHLPTPDSQAPDQAALCQRLDGAGPISAKLWLIGQRTQHRNTGSLPQQRDRRRRLLLLRGVVDNAVSFNTTAITAQ